MPNNLYGRSCRLYSGKLLRFSTGIDCFGTSKNFDFIYSRCFPGRIRFLFPIRSDLPCGIEPLNGKVE